MSVQESRSSNGKGGTSKSRYYTHPDYDFRIRVSDHWYIKGSAIGSGAAGTYTERKLIAMMEDGEAIRLANGLYVASEGGEILFSGKKPTVATIQKVLNSSEFHASVEALESGDIDAIKALNVPPKQIPTRTELNEMALAEAKAGGDYRAIVTRMKAEGAEYRDERSGAVKRWT